MFFNCILYNLYYIWNTLGFFSQRIAYLRLVRQHLVGESCAPNVLYKAIEAIINPKVRSAREMLTAESLTAGALTGDKRQMTGLVKCQHSTDRRNPEPRQTLSPEYLTIVGNMALQRRARPRSIMEDGKVALVTVRRCPRPRNKGPSRDPQNKRLTDALEMLRANYVLTDSHC